ncbi:hypothetical protein WJR50_13515 [Catalinimonas sp. 4WD22]|uniref:hypothetical protein n=1 Tax=Catalinimonas locisalis TaxID=3133978 RepID=UPI0031017DAB
MILDLFLAMVALGGCAFMGYLIGKKTATNTYETVLYEKQQALETAQQEQTGVNAQLSRCTRRRADAERKLADLKAKVESLEVKAKTAVAPEPQTTVVSENNAQKTKQEEVLDRIKAKAANIDFDRIGRSAKHEKDDLKLIKGVGPFIEQKLNALGVYTFEQVSNFNQDDETKVNEAIEFFPGRIRRDAWVKQAKALKDGKEKV